MGIFIIYDENTHYSKTSLVRASVVRGPSVVRGFQWLNFSAR